MNAINQQEELLIQLPHAAHRSSSIKESLNPRESSYSRAYERMRAHRLAKERENPQELSFLGETHKDNEFLKDIEELESAIQEKETEMNSPDTVEEENWSKADKFKKFKTRADRWLSTRPIMRQAIVTLLGDDLIATLTGLLRNVGDGVLNFANASEEAFKGLLKFALNVSSVGMTDGILRIAAKVLLPEHLQENARNLMRLPFRALENRNDLNKEIREEQLSAPWDHLNNYNMMEEFGSEQKALELFRAKKALQFFKDFNPSENELEQIKKFQMLARFLENGFKGALWASVPFFNRTFRTHILKADGFTGVQTNKAGDGDKEKTIGMKPLQKIAVGLSFATGFISQGLLLGLHKLSNGKNKLVNWIIHNTNFSNGLYPTKAALYMGQGLAYDAGRLANSQGGAEIYESGQITGIFTPILYFGDILTRFIDKIADNKLAKRHNLESGILVNKEEKASGFKGLINKFLPPEQEYADMMQKIDHNDNLKHDAKLVHADSTIQKLLLHSLIVLLTRMSINKHTKSFAVKHAA